MEMLKLGSVLSDIAMGPFGSNLKVENFQDHGVPVIRGQNLSGFYVSDENLVFVSSEKASSLSRALAKPGEIVVTHRGTLGQVSMIPENGKYDLYLVSQSQMRLTVDPERADARFITYWMRSPLGQHTLDSFATQTGVPAIAQPTASLREYPISLPLLSEQVAIVDLLSSLDDKIAADTSAKFMTEQLIDALVYENVSTCCSVTIADELILHYGKSLPASKRVPGQIPVIGSGGIVGWHSSPLIEDPTVVVGRKGSIGALHWIDSSSFPIDTTFWVQPKRLPTRILYSLLKLVDFSGSNTDSAVPGLNRSMAYEMPLPFISDEAVAAVWDKVSSLDALCSHLKREIACLEKTRDELLPLLMSGKITVKEAEQEASAAGADIASEENKA